MVTEGLGEQEPPEALHAALARTCGAADFNALTGAMDETAANVSGHYRRLIEEPAEQARARLPAGEEPEEQS